MQFASAYAVMARSLGIPARVAVGFTPGTEESADTYRVTSHDAHAWPEIYLSGLGWTHLFDPTPGENGRAPGGSNLPNDDTIVGPTATSLPPPTAATTPVPGGTTPAGGSGPAAPGTSPATPAPTPVPASSSSSNDAWLPVLVVLAIVVLLVGGYAGAVLGLKRRRRTRRHAGDPAAAVSGAWAEALDRLHEAAVVPRAAQTPLDLARAVPDGTSPTTARPMHELARAYGAARYSDRSLAPEDASDAWASLDELEDALDGGVSWTRRWRRRLDASTLVRR